VLGAEHEAGEEAQLHARRQVGEEVEVVDGLVAAQKAHLAHPAVWLRAAQRVPQHRIAHEIQHRVDARGMRRVPWAGAVTRQQRVALVLDEFQEIVELDPRLPGLLRGVFQAQAEVAHVFMGSRQHLLRGIGAADVLIDEGWLADQVRAIVRPRDLVEG
jgi:hypothetical protein